MGEHKIKAYEADPVYHDKLKMFSEKVLPVPKAAAKGKPGAKAKAKAKAAPAAAAGVIDDDGALFSEAAGRALLPPHPSSRLYRDAFNGRWLSYCLGQSKSRSFAEHGDTRSLCMVAAHAWNAFERGGGFPCPHDWVMAAAGAS